MKKGRRPRRRPRLKLSDKAGPDQCPVPGENALFPAQIAGFLAVSRPVPVYPVFLKYVVSVQEYGIQTMDTDGKVNYSLRNGGAIYYKSPVPDAEASELVVTCLDRQRTLDYILDKESFSVGTIIESIVGNLDEIGSATGFVLTLRSFADAAAKSSIKKAGGYTKIVNTYNPTYKEGASIVTGWSDHPFVVTPSDSYDHHVERFPEYVEP